MHNLPYTFLCSCWYIVLVGILFLLIIVLVYCSCWYIILVDHIYCSCWYIVLVDILLLLIIYIVLVGMLFCWYIVIVDHILCWSVYCSCWYVVLVNDVYSLFILFLLMLFLLPICISFSDSCNKFLIHFAGGSCQSSPCLNGATCLSIGSSFVCVCAENYQGQTCATLIGKKGGNMFMCKEVISGLNP